MPCAGCEAVHEDVGRLPLSGCTVADVLAVVNGNEWRSLRRSIFFDNALPERCLRTNCRFWKDADEDLDHLLSLYETARKAVDSEGAILFPTAVTLELSSTCNLWCAGCVCGTVRSRRKNCPPPHFLPTGTAMTVLETCKWGEAEVEVVRLHGRGEPLLHRDFYMIAERAKALYPQAPLRVDTNANFDYDSRLKVLDRVLCSVDGYDQASYEQYRRRGDYLKAKKFMADAIADGAKVTWKYILFDGITDTDEALESALKQSVEIGIPVWIMYSHTGGTGINKTALTFEEVDEAVKRAEAKVPGSQVVIYDIRRAFASRHGDKREVV